jgi:hypothetical protein
LCVLYPSAEKGGHLHSNAPEDTTYSTSGAFLTRAFFFSVFLSLSVSLSVRSGIVLEVWFALGTWLIVAWLVG